eukprot:gene57857-79277_t
MVQLLLETSDLEQCCQKLHCLNISLETSVQDLKSEVSEIMGISPDQFALVDQGGSRFLNDGFLKDYSMTEGSIVQARFLLYGGIDFQHREGSKVGSGGQLSESQAALERKERLRKLALETIDISKDPYFMCNHLETYECKLCLTLHPNEGNYL